MQKYYFNAEGADEPVSSPHRICYLPIPGPYPHCAWCVDPGCMVRMPYGVGYIFWIPGNSVPGHDNLHLPAVTISAFLIISSADMISHGVISGSNQKEIGRGQLTG